MFLDRNNFLDNLLRIVLILLSQNLAVLLRKGKNMIDITKVLNDILKAVLGKDVRQAIHDGVKRSNEIAG